MSNERGVYDMKHRSKNGGHLWAYAVNREGRIIEEREYGEGTPRTREQTFDELWDILESEDPDSGSRILPFPLLRETFGNLYDGGRFHGARLRDT